MTADWHPTTHNMSPHLAIAEDGAVVPCQQRVHHLVRALAEAALLADILKHAVKLRYVRGIRRGWLVTAAPGFDQGGRELEGNGLQGTFRTSCSHQPAPVLHAAF